MTETTKNDANMQARKEYQQMREKYRNHVKRLKDENQDRRVMVENLELQVKEMDYSYRLKQIMRTMKQGEYAIICEEVKGIVRKQLQDLTDDGAMMASGQQVEFIENIVKDIDDYFAVHMGQAVPEPPAENQVMKVVETNDEDPLP